MRNTRLFCFLMCASFFFTCNVAFSQIKKFYVWEKTYPCQDTRQDWFTVSQDYPGGIASTNSWQQADGPFDTFDAAMTAADGWKMSPRITKFKTRCCNDWNVYSKLIVSPDGSTTTNFSVGRSPQPAVNGLQQIAVGLCCEEAFEKAFTVVGSISDCRNLQLSTGATVTVQPDGNTFLPFSGTSPGGGGAGASLGCFRDTADFDLNGYLEQGQTNTVEKCVQACKDRGFAYAGVQYGMSCLCGNSYGKYGPAANCDYKCTGNQSEICGGYAANSVYATGVEGGKGNVGGHQPNCNPIKYNQKAQSYRGRNGEQINLCCPADSTAQGSIYGTDIYTDDSWICTAAIHAGIISPGLGGPVTLQVLPGQASYTASTRHNVTSGSWSGYSGSFTFAGISTTTTTTTENHEPPFVNQPEPNPPDPNPPKGNDDWALNPEWSGAYTASGCTYNVSASGKSLSANFQCEDGSSGSINSCRAAYVNDGSCLFTFSDKSGVSHSGRVNMNYEYPQCTKLSFVQDQPNGNSWVVWCAKKK